MKKISVKNFKGEEFEGMWNEKTYTSKIDGRSDLYRIYLDGESIHVEKTELEKIVVDIKVEERRRKEEKEKILRNWKKSKHWSENLAMKIRSNYFGNLPTIRISLLMFLANLE